MMNSYIICKSPWQTEPSVSRNELVSHHRTNIIVPSSVNDISGPFGALPFCGQLITPHGLRCKRYELPAPMPDKNSRGQDLNLILYGGPNSGCNIHISIAPGFSLQKHQDKVGDNCEIIYNIIDQHIDFVYDAIDELNSDFRFWEGAAGGIAIRSLQKTLKKWCQADNKNIPRMALVVKLARDLSKHVVNICENPRKVLARERQIENMNKVQQLDSACLRWLARQPGVTVEQKAGAKQRVLSVVRTEQFDTPENRVVRDFLKRGLIACKTYLREHQGYASHPRKLMVERFQRSLFKLLNNSPIAAVQQLAGVAQPNYVLLHDSRYNLIWKYYLLLVKQQTQQDSAIIWRHRLWAETCLMAIRFSLHALRAYNVDNRSDICFHPEQVAGQFINKISKPYFIPIGSEKQKYEVDWVDSDWQLHPYVRNTGLEYLCPDLVLVKRLIGPPYSCKSIIPIWCILDTENNDFQKQLEELSDSLKRLRLSYPFCGLIIKPLSNSDILTHNSRLCKGICVSPEVLKKELFTSFIKSVIEA